MPLDSTARALGARHGNARRWAHLYRSPADRAAALAPARAGIDRELFDRARRAFPGLSADEASDVATILQRAHLRIIGELGRQARAERRRTAIIGEPEADTSSAGAGSPHPAHR